MHSLILKKIEELLGFNFYVPDYRFFYILFILTAFVASNILAAKRGIPEKRMYKANLLIFGCTFLGARFYNIIHYVFQNDHIVFSEIFKLSGTGSFGAYLGFIFGSILTLRIMKINIRIVHDIYAPIFVISLILGRIGCFMTGCCYGKTSDLPWAVAFPAETPPYYEHLSSGLINFGDTYSLPVHPTQLYEVAFGLLTIWPIIFLYRRRILEGRLLYVYLSGYCLFRFIIEFFRGDNHILILNMTIPQLIAVLIFIVCIIGLTIISNKELEKNNTMILNKN